MTLDQFKAARSVLQGVIRPTNLIHSPALSKSYGNQVYLKPENMQVTGAYKIRGAYYKISTLSDDEKSRGLITASAGNHAQGVALAATRQGARSVVYMPDSAPISKVEATKRLGAEVVLVAGAYDDAYAAAVKAQEETGATFIHPFDDDEVIAGQGTIGLEILEQMRDVDAVIVPIGGGGLISGVAFAIKQLQPSVKVYGVQALNAPSMFESHRQGHQITLDTVHTFADGIAVKHPGDTTFSLVEKYVDDIVTVSEDEIATAILATIEKQKLIAEGAGAVSVAAAMFHKLPIIGKKVVCLVSGGNIDVTILSRVIQRGLLMTGRMCTLNIELLDKPGQLVAVSEIIARCGANVVGVHHEHAHAGSDVIGCSLRIDMETKDFGHIALIRKELEDAGFKIIE